MNPILFSVGLVLVIVSQHCLLMANWISWLNSSFINQNPLVVQWGGFMVTALLGVLLLMLAYMVE